MVEPRGKVILITGAAKAMGAAVLLRDVGPAGEAFAIEPRAKEAMARLRIHDVARGGGPDRLGRRFAGAVAFFLSNQASCMTGLEIVVDGGVTAV